MKTAVISLTEQGRILSQKVQAVMPGECVRYCFYQHTDGQAEHFENLSALVKQLFASCDALVFICACGIAVRMIAPHICSKLSDPAVLVMNDSGEFVVSVLAGHIGGANVLARYLAGETGAQAVITTATDSSGLFSPDCFAKANGLLIGDMDAAKKIAAAVLDGEKIGLVSGYPCENLPKCVVQRTDTRTGICICADMAEPPFPVTLHLIPKNIVLGVGCRRDTDPEKFEEALLSALGIHGIEPRRICAAATIDLKKNEPAILQFCRKYDIPAVFYTAEELMQVPGEFASSAYVKSVTGADNVCERSAVLYSGGKLTMRKTAGNGITAAAAEMPVRLDFAKEMHMG